MWFILARVSTLPGGSATEGYRAARAERRRAMVRCLFLTAVAVACGWAALQASGAPRLAAGVIGAGALAGAFRLRPQPDPERWLRGAAGEGATAELLARLPGRSWAVLHDLAIPGHRANIDHLVIGPTGVWVIDTKTTRAKARTGWRSLWLGERKLDSGPVRWEAGTVSEMLGVRVRPLIALHGGGLRPRGGRAGRVRVVPAGSLLGRLRRGRRRLDRRQVHQLTCTALELLPPARLPAIPGRQRYGRRG
jgi:Nuclease-related domain